MSENGVYKLLAAAAYSIFFWQKKIRSLKQVEIPVHVESYKWFLLHQFTIKLQAEARFTIREVKNFAF